MKGKKMVLKKWSIIGDDYKAPELECFYLQGIVYGHPKFANGAPITTSRIVKIKKEIDRKKVFTCSGAIYVLFPRDVDPKYEAAYPNSYERLSIK